MKKVFKLKAKLDDVTFEFEEPIVIAGKPVSKLVMREPLVRDIDLVVDLTDELLSNKTLIANLTGLTVDDVTTLPYAVFGVLLEGLESFQPSQETTS